MEPDNPWCGIALRSTAEVSSTAEWHLHVCGLNCQLRLPYNVINRQNI